MQDQELKQKLLQIEKQFNQNPVPILMGAIKGMDLHAINSPFTQHPQFRTLSRQKQVELVEEHLNRLYKEAKEVKPEVIYLPE